MADLVEGICSNDNGPAMAVSMYFITYIGWNKYAMGRMCFSLFVMLLMKVIT